MAALVLTSAFGAACRRPRRPRPAPAPVAAPAAPVAEAEPVEDEAPRDPDELMVGPDQAFGLPVPLGASLRHESPAMKLYDVPASAPRVLRFLERRLTVRSAEVGALGSFLRGARLREGEGRGVFDVGVRDEGGHTQLSVWDRTAPLPAPAPPVNTAPAAPRVAF
ncbi:MAG: hypothetical protein JNK72_08050 [Myxococcales bacterium]|nr:hypothetical protein [Myxococcales bacterium]